MSTFVIFAVAGAGTFGLRIAMILGEQHFASAARIQRHISLVSPAVLAAIVAAAVLTSNGDVALPNLVTLAALAAGSYAVHRTGNVGFALAAGLPVYWLGVAVGLV